MNKLIVFAILISIGASLTAQNLNPKKSELKKIFRKSIVQNYRKTISTLSNPWVTDNTDSLYFKTDTIKLINIKNAPFKYDFCEKVNWSFYRKDKFYLVESQVCREPTTVKVSNPNSRYWIKVKNSDIGLILLTENLSGIVDRFLVLSIKRNKIKDEITLKRLGEKASG